MRTYEEYQSILEDALPNALPKPEGLSAKVLEAARYSLLGGGKRLRGVLLLAACDFAGRDIQYAISAACAVECLHAYSLIHDDLPAMDNDDMRRGKPSCHKAFGEDMAILAGDGLNTHAFLLLTMGMLDDKEYSPRHMAALYQMGVAAGFLGMVGGQCADIMAGEKDKNQEALSYIQSHKTAALIRASLLSGLSIGGCNDKNILNAFTIYGNHIGLAFQAADDVLDATSTPEMLGKTPGKDLADGKLSCVSMYGLQGAKQRVGRLSEAAKKAIGGCGENSRFFVELADALAVRKG